MSWEIFVQVWLFTIVGFVVGVVLTWLIGVLPLRRRLARQERQDQQARRARAEQAGTRAASAPETPRTGTRAEGVATLAGTPAATRPEPETPERAEPKPEADSKTEAPAEPTPSVKRKAPAEIPQETPEEQTVVLEAFDFGGPESRSQTRDLPQDDEDEGAEPWRPEVRIDPNDRLSDQLGKRQPQPDQEPLVRRTEEPGMFEPAAEPDPESAPEPAADDWRSPESSPSPFEQARPGESSVGTGFSFLDRPAEPAGGSSFTAPEEQNGFPEPFPDTKPDPDSLPRRTPGVAAASVDGGPLGAEAGSGGGGSLFDPSADLSTAPSEEEPAVGPFGPGSALPHADGSAPGTEFTVKARTSSMVFHTEESPFFDRLLPQVWFRSIDEAKRAGFTSWDRPNEG